jgi:hypothetical protein
MKPKITLCLLLFSVLVSAQTPKTSALNVALTDSVIGHYMADLGGIDTTAYVLLEDSGYYFFDKGEVVFKSFECEATPPISGIITKLKERRDKMIIKIYFDENKTYCSKVKLVRESTTGPWLIRSRFIYQKKKLAQKKPRLLYYSFDS